MNLLFRELEKGLEPSTTCLQDRCATDCATPAGAARPALGPTYDDS